MEIWLLVGRLILTGLLYLFLAAVFIVLWRDMRWAGVAARQVSERPGRLVVVEGNPQLPVGAAWLLQPFTTLGRGAANTIVLPETYVSAEHALITLRNGQWWLEDRDSRNGTLVNDFRIDEPTVLSDGDVIGIGRLRLRVEIEMRDRDER